MALQKQKIALTIGSGIETKFDENQQPLATFKRLENVVFDEIGKAKKRKGYDALTNLSTDGSLIENGQKLFSFRNELNLIADNKIYSYIESINRFQEKGDIFPAIPVNKQIVRTNIEQTNYDCVHERGLDVYVFEDANGVSLTLVDNASNNFIISNKLLSATGTNPRVVARNGFVYCFYLDGNDIKYRKFSIFDFNNIASEVIFSSSIEPSAKIYDVVMSDNNIIVGYNTNTAGGTLGFQELSSSDSVGSLVEVAGETASVSLDLSTDKSFRILCAYSNGLKVSAVAFSNNLGTKIIAETVLETINDIVNVSITEKPESNEYIVFYEISDTNPYDHFIKTNTISLSASIGTPSIVTRSVGLASKAFNYNTDSYIMTIHQSELQNTYFLINSEGAIVTKALPNIGGTIRTTGNLPRVTQLSSDNTKFLSVNQIKGRLQEDNGTFFTLLGINGTIFDFDPEGKYESELLAEVIHIAGGYTKMYDGRQVVEHGFHLFPETLTNTGSSTVGGSIQDGTRQYQAVYSWTDAFGNIHKSAPSIALQVSLSGGTSTQTQNIEVPALRITDKSDVVVELYRTEANGTIFYKVGESNNDSTVNSISIQDTVSDADLISNELIYTTGGVLENIAAPASSIIESFKNRIFTTSEGSERLNYSKIVFDGSPVEFNDTLQIKVPGPGGKIVALREMDDKLIIFKESAIYYLQGDGPNNLGEQDTFIEPELISSDIGCKTQKSLVLSDSGVLFQSQKGIYLLTRGLQLSYIGSAVEEYNHLNITSAIVVADQNQIRFTTSDGDCLVANFFQNKWSTFTNHRALSAVEINNTYYYLRTNGTVFKESENYSDNGSTIKTVIETGWLNFSGIQSLQRVYRMLVVGNIKSNHKVRIKVAYDFVNAWIQETLIDTSTFTDLTPYGESSPYGSEATYGAANQYQFRVDFKKQKCENIKIRIEDSLSEIGAGMEISNLLFVVGAKVGEEKPNQSQIYGTK